MDEIIQQVILNELEPNINLAAVVAGIENNARPVMNEQLVGMFEEPTRNLNFYEVIIPGYSDMEFKEHFRMSRNSFRLLQNRLEQGRMAMDKIPYEKKLLFSIWLLAKQETFFSVGNLFNIPKSTGNNIFYSVISDIANLRAEYIRWPNEDERRNTCRVLREKTGIPGIIGAIDGTHITIKAPPHNAVDYYNRNNSHSVILQAVCNEKKEFIDTYAGKPGRLHDARVFRESPLFHHLTTRNIIDRTEHLLGDKAYPLSLSLVTPYRDNGHLTAEQTRFNIRMSSARVLIEQSFGLLKGKWRRLKYLDMTREEMIPVVITAACVLHNFVLRNEGEDAEIDENLEIHDGLEDFERNVGLLAEGARKRDYLASILG